MVTKAKKAKRQQRRNAETNAKLLAAWKNAELTAVEDSEVTLLASETEDGSNVTKFEMSLYGGGPMRPEGLRAVLERMNLDANLPVVIDIKGISFPKNQRVPSFLNHDPTQIVGHTESITAGNTLSVSGRISGTGAAASEVVGNSKAGFPWQASLGVNLSGRPEFIPAGKSVNVNGRRQSGPFLLAPKSTLNEASFVPLGADRTTRALAAQQQRLEDMNPEFKNWLEEMGLDASSLSDDAIEKLEAKWKSETESAASASTSTVTAKNESNITGARGADESGMLEAQAAMFDRVAAVQEKLGEFPKLAATAIREKWTDDRIDTELRAHKAETELKAFRDQMGSGPGIHQKTSESASNPDVIVAAMLRSYTGDESFVEKEFGDKTLTASREAQQSGHIPRTPSLKYLLHETIRAGGGHVNPGFSTDDDVIRAALGHDNKIRANHSGGLTAASGFSTVSVSGILSAYAHKLMLRAFESVESRWREVSITRPHTNFKEHRKYRRYGMQDLEVVGRGGEIKHTKISEASYVNSLDTYARMMALTRQDMIDDDLGAFSEIPEGFGDISARTLEKSVWTRFLDNTSGFLSVTPTGYRQNLLAAGAGSALSVTSLEEAKVLFAQQQDEDGNPIMVSPSVLLSGETVAETANSLLNKTTIEVVGDGSGSDFRTAEQFRGRFRPVSTPWLGTPAGLTGSSDTAWYLIGKSSIYAPIEVAFLNGQAGPTIASDDTDFNTLGRQWRVFFDWGVAKFEPRMVVGSPGA